MGRIDSSPAPHDGVSHPIVSPLRRCEMGRNFAEYNKLPQLNMQKVSSVAAEAERQSMAVENKVLTWLRFHTSKNLHQQLVMSWEGDQMFSMIKLVKHACVLAFSLFISWIIHHLLFKFEELKMMDMICNIPTCLYTLFQQKIMAKRKGQIRFSWKFNLKLTLWRSCSRRPCRRRPRCCTPRARWCSNPCPWGPPRSRSLW